jgi:hypothetical protein
MFRTGAQFMFLVLLAGAALMFESRKEPLAAWDNGFADFLARNSRRTEKTAPVTLVAITDRSLALYPWPWTPVDFSLFFQAAVPTKAEVLATDEVLDWNRFTDLPAEQKQLLPGYEKILRDQMLTAPKVLLGSQLGFPEDPTVIPPLQEVPTLRQVTGTISGIPEFTAIELQPTEGFRRSATIGFTNLPAVYERYNSVPLVLRYRGQIVPTFVLQAVMLWAQLTPDDVTVVLGSHVQIGKNLRVPVDAAGRMRVDFGSPRGNMTFDDLILSSETLQEGRTPQVSLEPLKGAIVLLSRTDTGSRSVALAANRMGSPGELFASAIATIQNQSFIQRSPLWLEGGIVAVFMGLSYRIPRMKKLKVIGIGLFSLVVYVMIAMAVFSKWLLWLPATVPLGAVLVFVLLRVVTPDSAGRPKRPVIF